jgi:hypothetical protein
MGRIDATGQRLSLLRIPFGLDRLPRDITLRSVEVDAEPLRLNTAPVPTDAMPLAVGDHAARITAAIQWLESLCGNYAPLRRQFINRYFGFIAAQIESHREELIERVKPFDGLYAPEDFLWSALRPLPRGWVPVQGALLPADMVFWDGLQAVAIELSARDTGRQKALAAAGAIVLRIEPDAFPWLGDKLPGSFQRFWEGQMLPASPFRRIIPNGGDGFR